MHFSPRAGMNLDVKPCPFCGNEYGDIDHGESGPSAFIRCPKCGACGPDGGRSPAAAVREWNMRKEEIR